MIDGHISTDDLTRLRIIGEFGWIRTRELGNILWPDSIHSTKYAELYSRKYIDFGYLISRKLPSRAGSALLLSKKGATILTEKFGISFISGKNWGRSETAGWRAPNSWCHDLYAQGILARYAGKGFPYITERRFRTENAQALKIPDGLIYSNKSGRRYWLEVENARKNEKNFEALILNIINGGFYFNEFSQKKEQQDFIIASSVDKILPEQSFNRHEKAIIEDIKGRGLKKDLSIIFLNFTVKNFGVDLISARTVSIKSSAASLTLRKLNRYGWFSEGEGVIGSFYAGFDIKIRKQWEGGYTLEIYDCRDNRPHHERIFRQPYPCIHSEDVKDIESAKIRAAYVVSGL